MTCFILAKGNNDFEGGSGLGSGLASGLPEPDFVENIDILPPPTYEDAIRDHYEVAGTSGDFGAKEPSYEHIHYTRADLEQVMLLGKGDFGEVYVARAPGLWTPRPDNELSTDETGETGHILVKSLDDAVDYKTRAFQHEVDMFHLMRHENIAQLLAICWEASPQLMLMEYTDWVSTYI